MRVANAWSRINSSAIDGSSDLKCGGWYMSCSFPHFTARTRRRQCKLRISAMRSLPLDRGGRLAAHVVGDAVDAAYLVDDAARDFLEQAIRQLGPVGRHEVAGLHSP